MKKLTLAIGLYMGVLLSASAQKTADTSNYQSRKLKVEEINIVSSYYHQDGNNSAVTGGIGTEKLTDFGNTFDIRFSKWDSKARQHFFTFELGVDAYSSASSDKIDPYTVSSASMTDKRIYPSLAWSVNNAKKGTTFGAVASYSTEYDYKSYGTGLNFSKTSKDGNREFSAKVNAFFDTWKVILPSELRTIYRADGTYYFYGSGGEHDPYPVDYKPRNSYSSSFSLAQVVNKRMQVLLTVDPAYQAGLLATKYQRVYFTDGTVKSEELPDTRFKLPIGARLNYFAGNKVVIRTFYRYYQDNWGVKAHTFELETPIKMTPFLTLSPYYRYYTQTAADYFAAYGVHKLSDQYYTSDYDLSKLNSNMVGTGIRIMPPHGVFGIQSWASLELRYGHYMRSNGLNSDAITLYAKFK